MTVKSPPPLAVLMITSEDEQSNVLPDCGTYAVPPTRYLMGVVVVSWE